MTPLFWRSLVLARHGALVGSRASRRWTSATRSTSAAKQCVPHECRGGRGRRNAGRDAWRRDGGVAASGGGSKQGRRGGYGCGDERAAEAGERHIHHHQRDLSRPSSPLAVWAGFGWLWRGKLYEIRTARVLLGYRRGVALTSARLEAHWVLVSLLC